jgi:hypothetical protein
MQRKLILEANILQLETGGVTIRDSTINSTLEALNAGSSVVNRPEMNGPSLSELGQEFLSRDQRRLGFNAEIWYQYSPCFFIL